MDWKTAELRDYMELDNRLYPMLTEAQREGMHLALLYSILHSSVLREESHKIQCALNEMEGFRFIRDNGDLPLTPETILSIYGAMLGGAEAGWKESNANLETIDGFYVTQSAEETPETMQELCLQYSCLNDPDPEHFDEIFKFILSFICIHPFRDGNGRMSALLLQFLLQKAGLRCAVFLPIDIIQNGVFMTRTCRQIRKASGVYYGMKPLEYDRYIPFMKEVLADSYQIMLDAAEKQ